ncbi:MAG: hypothetical protein ACLTL9_05985 [Akkermansia muciniphila]
MKQYITCFTLAIITIFIEEYTQSRILKNYILENGITLLLALLAINVTSCVYTISRLLQLEDQYKSPGHFKKSKKEALFGFKEQFLFIIISLLSIIICPLITKLINTYKYFEFLSYYIGLIPILVLLTAVYFSIYATYDYAKSIIQASMDPND